ncbi:MAG: type II toxin-antitoxin system HicB family antitoxin [Anaerolineae bacterium]|nr:type II toxin-antitoxin system HicB family antitoxin [Anaerolineae bacterium]MDW8070547.1 type II toxin-antitoxin system HicB family antitoxin [Anaerolineae bacterium]
MQTLTYRMSLRKEPEGGYPVIVPSRLRCVTYGATLEGSVAVAREANALSIESPRAYGEEILAEEAPLEYTVTLPVHA